MHICVCMYIPNYNLLFLYSVCFQGWPLGTRQLMCPFWGRPPLPLPAFLSCLQFFVYGWGLMSFPICPPVSSLFSSWLAVILSHFMGIASHITRRYYFIENSLILWLLQSFHPLFHNVFWVLCECFIDVSIGTKCVCVCVWCHCDFSSTVWMISGTDHPVISHAC